MKKALKLSEGAIADLKRSGLSDETIKEAGILPLDNETFKRYIGYSLIEKPTRQPIILDGYVIPYQTTKETFGRVKVLEWNTRSLKYQQYLEPPKYLQATGSGNHLYILPRDLKKLKSPKAILVITEGEKKTLKLSQELRRLDSDFQKYAPIGVSGVYNWKNCPEWSEVPLKNRKVFIAFDSDGLFNPQVARAEIQLVGYLLSAGALEVKSFLWDIKEGKGIDDYLTGREEKLPELFYSATSPILKYSDTINLETAVECLAIYLTEFPANIIEDLKKAYNEGKTAIRRLFKRKRKELMEKIQEEILHEQAELVRDIFGVGYTPRIPEGFFIREGFLWYKDEKLTEAFVVKSLVVSAEKTGSMIELRFIGDREVVISDRELSSSKRLAELLNKNGVFVDEGRAKYIAKYIAGYIADNKEIPKREYISELGWKDKQFFLPQTAPNCLFDESIEGVGAKGDRQKEYEAVKEIVENYDSGLFWFVGLMAPALYIVNPGQATAVFYTYGQSGVGKTISNQIALSTYGDPVALSQNMNFTSVGEEIFLSTHKDLAVLFDEIETKASKPDRIANEVAELIFRFSSGKGRTRANTSVKLRKHNTFRGVLLLTAERSLSSVLIGSGDTSTKLNHGVFRRTVQIPASKLKLFDYKLPALVNALIENHGNLFPEWIAFLRNKENQTKLKELTELYIDSLIDKGFEFRGQERVLGLLYAIVETAGELFKFDVSRYSKALWTIAEENYEVFYKTVLDPLARFWDDLEDFINKNVQYFLLPKDDDTKARRMNKFYGKREDESLYITPLAFKQFCNEYKYDQHLLLERLLERGILAPSRDRNRTTVYFRGDRKKAYRLILNEEVDGVEI